MWLVDAFQRSDEPGTLQVLAHSEIAAIRGSHRSAHQLSLPDGLRWLLHTYPGLERVEFRLWGVEPKAVAPTPRLSRQVAAAAKKLASAIAREAAKDRSVECD